MSDGSQVGVETVVTDAETSEHGAGSLSYTGDHVVFEGKDDELLSVPLDRIDAMEYYTGEGFTEDSQAGLALAVLGVALAVLGTAIPKVGLLVYGIAFLTAVVGLSIGVIYYDATEGLRVHTPAKTWTFQGDGLREFSRTVRTDRE